MKFAGMEENNHHHNQELKFVCKQCNKRYPCGKSLGGHMRSHVIANSAEIMEEKSDPKRDQNQNQSRFEHGGYSTYGLRENPKKTWRAVDSTSALPQEKACKQCGKVFQSLKALCGHMACHSEKDRGGGVKDDHSWNSSESKKLEEEEEIDDDDDEESDADSDTEAEEEQIQIPTTTTNPKRYKKIVVKSYSLSVTNNNNNNNNNSIGSSSVSEIDEQEQEEVAKCLMMLSKDSGNWYGSHVNSVVEFSDNNSVVLETKSSSIDMKKRNSNKVCCYKDNETPPTKKIEDSRGKLKLKSSIVVESQSSDSGYFLGENKVESSDVSVNGLHTKRKVHEFGVASNYGKKKRTTTNDTSYDPEVETGSYNNNNNKKMKLGLKLGSSPSGTNNGNNKKKYECFNCKKSFSSYQALGGHRPCHKKTNADHESSYGTGENSLDADDTYNKIRDSFGRKKVKDSSEKKANNKATKKGKGHECPFCHRMFKSGQALGGHKRSHFIGGAQVINGNNHHQTPPPVVAKEEVTDLLDLNLPAPVDEDEEQMMGW